jgi:hypothetical protein
MSLVNDALKRAKDTAPKGITPAVGPMRLAETVPRSRSSGFLISMLALVILLLAGLLLWQWSHGGNSELKVRANARPAVEDPAPAPQVSQNLLVTAPPPSAPPTAAVAPEPVMTNVVAVAPPKPAPITYKLQSVVFLPKNPSAIINGREVFVNGSVDGARVVAIGPGTATIVTPAGQTNVLVMR